MELEKVFIYRSHVCITFASESDSKLSVFEVTETYFLSLCTGSFI